MQDDVLGQFPKPAAPAAPVEPVQAPPAVNQYPAAAPAINDAPLYHDPFATQTLPVTEVSTTTPTEPTIPEPIVETTPPPVPAFEETPDEIPSVQSAYTPAPSIEPLPADSFQTSQPEPAPIAEPTPEQLPPLAQPDFSIPEVQPVVTPPVSSEPEAVPAPTEITQPETPAIVTQAPPVTPPVILQPSPATLPTSSAPSLAPIIFIGLLAVAGIGLAASVFLFSQSAQLKRQLTDITQTLNKQDTTVTPTPTSTPIEVITPSILATPTPDSTISATPTPTVIATPTPMVINSATPLLYAKQALKVALNKEPNAQLILIKTENASDTVNSITKYFFRQDLKTKKYFYVTVLDKSDPAIIDKAIYVTPDNDIPSLNEAVSSESFGMDLDKAIKLAYEVCTSGLCQTSNLKSQFIKSNSNYIWQLAFTPTDITKSPLIIQIDSVKKEILYKSPGF